MRSFFAFVTAVLLGFGSPALALAQDASPAATEGLPEGVELSVLAQSAVDQLAPGRLDVGLVRLTILPGARLHISQASGPTLLLVESGAFTFAVATEMPAAIEEPSGTPAVGGVSASSVDFTLTPGRSAVFPADAVGEARNEGTEPAVAVALFAGPPQSGMATPVAQAADMAAEVAAGITVEPLALGVSEPLPAGPVALAIVRLRVAPGVAVPPQPHPGPHVGIIEAGSFTFHTVEGPAMTVLHGIGALATPGAETSIERAGPEQDLTAIAGDGFFVPTGSLSSGTAGSDAEAVALFGVLTPLGRAVATPGATPAA